jgi:replication factor C subunit 2/4
VIDSLLNAVGVTREDGISPALIRGGFETVRKAVKKIGREGWSAGQVLEQVRPLTSRPSTMWSRIARSLKADNSVS